MDNESLDWLAVQCQFRNGLAAAALDSMAYTLLCEVVERTPYWCDPVHYVELDMGDRKSVV